MVNPRFRIVLPVLITTLAPLGCVSSHSTECAWGEVCPQGQQCHTLTESCVLPAQLEACAAHSDGDPCEYANQQGICDRGVCDPGFEPGCGNQLIEGDEVCDGTNLGGRTCELEGHYAGVLTCLPDCSGFDTTACGGACGDGTVNGEEACDGGPPPQVTCDDLGYPGGGTPSCTACQPDSSTCCQDEDGDGYGPHCTLGEDCDDSAPGVTGPCQTSGCPAGWVFVPAGAFQMGCNSGELDDTCNSEEQPRHTVTLSSGYCLQAFEADVATYRACVEAGVCPTTLWDSDTILTCNYSAAPAGREAHPVNCLSWDEARTLCRDWLGGDLPTEAQWEKAARGADPDTRKYPWGSSPEPDCTRANFDTNGAMITGVGCAKVEDGGAFFAVNEPTSGAGDSPFGLRNAAGNVWEWVFDHWDAEAYLDCDPGCTEPVNDSGIGDNVLRGGGLTSLVESLRVVTRLHADHGYRDDWIGVRCLRQP